MKKVTLIPLFIFIFSLSLFSQGKVDIPFFDKMSGSWEGTYKANANTNNEQVNVSWILDHAFIQIDVNGSVKDGGKNYSQKLIFTIDNSGNLVGWGISNYGYDNMTLIKHRVGEIMIHKGMMTLRIIILRFGGATDCCETHT